MGNDNLLHRMTPFIGRADEVTQLGALLNDPACRLLTLVGPGGIGKTRLAVEAAETCTSDFADRICFVPLQPVQSADLILPTIADAIGFALSGSHNLRSQLFHHLREQNMLLILDNMEHLLDGSDLVADMLAATSQLKVVATSREALNLREEWLYPVEGLPYPANDQVEGSETFSAFQLFVSCARRVRPNFVLSGQQAAIIRICRLVNGIPLALELAAAWVRALPCETIATEIKNGLNLLETSARNIEPRHRSMRAALDWSWNLLTPEEQNILQKLSVFRGGFTLDAAAEVARASFLILVSLVDKSLVHTGVDGRYDLHELLRQYLSETLDQRPEMREVTLDQHCNYYTEFLHQRETSIYPSHQAEALKELDNLRVAWRRAVQQRNLEALIRAAPSLYWLYHFQAWADEAAAVFYLAEKALREMPSTDDSRFLLGMTRLLRGFYQPEQLGDIPYPPVDIENTLSLWDDLEERPEMGLPLTRALLGLLFYNGDPQQIMATARRSLAFCQRFNDQPGMAISLTALAVVSYQAFGELDEAWRLLEEALTIDRQIGFHLNARWAAGILGHIAYIQGRYGDSKTHYEMSVTHHHAGGIFRSLEYHLFDLGRIEMELCNDVNARMYFTKILTLASDFTDDYQRSLAIAKGHTGLGMLAAFQGDAITAAEHYADSYAHFKSLGMNKLSFNERMENLSLLALLLDQYEHALALNEVILSTYRDTGYRTPLMCAQNHAGHALIGLANQTQAKAYLIAAFREAVDMGALQVLLETLVGIAQLSTIPPMIAVELLTLVCHHPAANRYSRTQAKRVQTRMESLLSQDEFADARERGQALSLDAAVSLVEKFGFDSETMQLRANQKLIDPLSQRELEVLALIAKGLTNQEIANQLYIGVSTVKKHINRIFHKLDATHRVQAVACARALNILP